MSGFQSEDRPLIMFDTASRISAGGEIKGVASREEIRYN